MRPIGRNGRTNWRRLVVPAVCAVLALAVLAPLLSRGFVLSYDMVFAPRQSLLPDGLGLGSALPRSVPADAAVALATLATPGDIVQKIVLFVALFGGAFGAARLVPTESTWTRVVAAVAYGWSAYVAERLFMGHWPYLLAYACLPWIVKAGLAVRRGEPKAGAKLIIACAPAVLTPTGGIIAAATAIVSTGGRKAWLVAAAVLVLNAPWWVPAVLHPGGTLSAADGVDAFSAREESWGTPVTSLLGLGGIWNAEVTPASRSNPLVPVLTLATVGVALLGLRVLARRWGTAPTRALVLLGVFGVLLAALGSLPIGVDLLRWMVANVPGTGLLRDSQKWVAWWALPLAIGFALAVETAAEQLRGPAAKAVLLAGATVFPVAIMPDLAWGGWGRLDTVDYPSDWSQVRQVLASDERAGDVLALPLSTFRQFGWNANRTQLDPAPRVLPRTTVIDDTVAVGGRLIPGEDRRVTTVRSAVIEHGDLGRLGIGWVLVEHGTPGWVNFSLLSTMDEVYNGQWLSLYRIPGNVLVGRGGPPPVPVLAADIVALGLITLSWLWWALPAGRLSGISRRDRFPEE